VTTAPSSSESWTTRLIVSGSTGRGGWRVRRNGRRGLRAPWSRRGFWHSAQAAGTTPPARAADRRNRRSDLAERRRRRWEIGNPKMCSSTGKRERERGLSAARLPTVERRAIGQAYQLGREQATPNRRRERKSRRKLLRWRGQRHLALAQRFGLAQLLAAFSAVGERLPRCLGPAATLAHMVERCRIRLTAGLLGTGEEELQVRIADDWPGQIYSAWSSDSAALLSCAASSAGFRFTAAILPRLSCCTS